MLAFESIRCATRKTLFFVWCSKKHREQGLYSQEKRWLRVVNDYFPGKRNAVSSVFL